MRLANAERGLEAKTQSFFTHQHIRVTALVRALAHLDPRAVLERGYSIATGPDGHIVSDVATLAIGDRLKVLFAHGSAETEVMHTDDGNTGLENC